jgi:2-dehydropantoate 2-reductase
MDPCSVAVVGAGAVGTAVAVALAEESPHRVTVCVRRPLASLEVRRRDGSVLRSTPQLATDPATVEPVDAVLLATKTYQSAGAAGWLQALCRPGTVVAVLQNGIDQVERIGPLAPGAPIVPVAVLLTAEAVAPGVAECHGDALLEVPDDPDGHLVASLFAGTGVRVVPVADFLTRAWRKLLMNAVVGAVGALTLRDLSVLSEPAVEAVALALADEVVAVGRAEGAALDAELARRALAAARKGAPGHRSSITVDRQAGRPLEWEARNAVIGRLGRRHGIPTPLNDLVTALLAACDPR